MWTDPGWNLHQPSEVCIDSFQAERAPDLRYRTAPLGALFTHLKGGFYHDGRFPTLAKVVDHIERVMKLAAGNKSAAAKLLGVDRRTLLRKGF